MKKNLLLFIISLIIGILFSEICSEIVFFVQHRDWYSRLSLHVRQRKLANVVKDKVLVSTYEQYLLHKVPDEDSALREYVEVINFVKRPNVHRILCIGGSTTRGVGVIEEQSYPSFLQQELDEKYPGEFEVFNLGLHSGVTQDFIERFYRASSDANFGWRDLNPDLVILAPVWNDLHQETLGVGRVAEILSDWSAFIKTHLSSRLALGHYIYLGFERLNEGIRNKYFLYNKKHYIGKLEAGKIRFRERLVKCVDLWQKRGVRIYLVLFPGLIEEGWSDDDLRQFVLNYNYNNDPRVFFGNRKWPTIQRADYEVITSVARECKIKCFDFSDSAKGLSPVEKCNPVYFIDPLHLGPHLNHWIAKGLFSHILKDLD